MQKNLQSFHVKQKLVMVHQINQGKSSYTMAVLCTDEITLVRKTLDWKYKSFEIPKNILSEWKKVGNKGIKLESSWNKLYKRKKLTIDKILKK